MIPPFYSRRALDRCTICNSGRLPAGGDGADLRCRANYAQADRRLLWRALQCGEQGGRAQEEKI